MRERNLGAGTAFVARGNCPERYRAFNSMFNSKSGGRIGQTPRIKPDILCSMSRDATHERDNETAIS
jgi:hypothetical protein